jgi:hypothetical protein
MAIIAPTNAKMKVIKDKISKAFKIMDNGALHWMLGVSIRHEAKTLKISQAAYIRQILTRFELADIRPLSIPVDPDVTIVADMGEAVSSRKFCKMLGAIMYTAIWTRPDLTYAVNRLAQYQDKPCTGHHTALLRLYAYLKYTVDLGITYGPTRMPLSGYADADGMTTEGRHAVSGYVFCIDGRAISWSSKRQELVTLLTNKVEYITLTHAAKEAIWLSMLRAEIFGLDRCTVPLKCDNNGAIALACNDRYHACTKHIDICYHFIHERVEGSDILLDYIHTSENTADMFTKGLHSAMFNTLVKTIGLGH